MSALMRNPRQPSFAERVRDARCVLVIELGGLGDALHALPALWLLRQGCPQARLLLMVPASTAALFHAAAPWIDELLPYRKQGWRGDLAAWRSLRAARPEAAIAITASNHAIGFVGLSGARYRLARKADENKRWRWQPLLLSDVIEVPFHREPMYWQKWRFLRAAGFAGEQPEFHVTIDPQLRRAVGISADDDRRYLHLSASATDDRRDLPAAQMIALWEALRQALPGYRFAVSALGNPRGLAKLDALLAGLSFTPWKVFRGTLDAPSFAAVIAGAALHVGPDSGGLHVARVFGTPSVSWFRDNHHLRNWLPTEAEHLALVAPNADDSGLHGIDTAALVRAADRLLQR